LGFRKSGFNSVFGTIFRADYEERIKKLNEALKNEEKNYSLKNQELEIRLDDLGRDYEKNMIQIKKELSDHRYVLVYYIISIK